MNKIELDLIPNTEYYLFGGNVFYYFENKLNQIDLDLNRKSEIFFNCIGVTELRIFNGFLSMVILD